MRAKTAGIADIAQKAAGHAVFANDHRASTIAQHFPTDASVPEMSCQ
jgi:hypothetical protein